MNAALWLTNGVIQVFLISTLFSEDAFTLMLKLTSAMVLVPYFLVAAYGLLIAWQGETYATRPEDRRRDIIVGGLATLYTAFMIYAGGLKFLLLSAILYAPGTLLFVWTRREQGKRVFTSVEWGLFLIAIAGCAVGIYGIVAGHIVI